MSGICRSLDEILSYLKTNTQYIDGHWLFNNNNDSAGYGFVRYNTRRIRIHRFIAYVCLGLKLESRKQANHKRTCPYRNCWNPLHIYIGTPKENVADSVATGTFISGWSIR